MTATAMVYTRAGKPRPGLTRRVVFCDECHKPIPDAKGKQRLHKGDCARAARNKNQRRYDAEARKLRRAKAFRRHGNDQLVVKPEDRRRKAPIFSTDFLLILPEARAELNRRCPGTLSRMQVEGDAGLELSTLSGPDRRPPGRPRA